VSLNCGTLEIMRQLLIPVVLFFFAAPYTLAAPESFIGREIPPIPASCEDKGGGILDRDDKFAEHQLLCNGHEIILLERFIERRGKNAYWNVIDELRLPLLKHGRTILSVPLCQSSTYADSAILAVGVWGPTRADNSFVAKEISNAWRFNLEEGKIQPIPTSSVICEGENAD
jgi:hypothetical protein